MLLSFSSHSRHFLLTLKTPFLPLSAIAGAALLMAPCLKADTAVPGDALDVAFGNVQAALPQPGFAFYNGGDANGAVRGGSVSGVESFAAGATGNGTGNTVTVGLTPDDAKNPEVSFDRQGGNGQYFGTYYQFYDAWIGLNNFTINVTGLAPISTYQITIQNFDQYGPGTATITDATPNGITDGAAGTASYVGTANGGAADNPSSSLGMTAGESPAVFQFVTNLTGDASFGSV